MKPETWKYIRDQSAHFFSCWFLTILSIFPILRNVVVAFWACTREYYQHKIYGLDFFENVFQLDLTNRDLKYSYAGTFFGLLCEVGLWIYLLKSGKLLLLVVWLGG